MKPAKVKPFLLWLVPGMIPLIILGMWAIPELKKRKIMAQKTQKVLKKIEEEYGDFALSVYSMKAFKLKIPIQNTEHLYLNIKTGLGYRKEFTQLGQELFQLEPELEYKIKQILCSITPSKLNQALLREELKQRIKTEFNKLLKSGKIEEVYFDEFLVSRLEKLETLAGENKATDSSHSISIETNAREKSPANSSPIQLTPVN